MELNSNTIHAGERDYEALLLSHGLVDSIVKNEGNVQFVLSTKGVETLCRIGMTVLPQLATQPTVQPHAETTKDDTADKLITKKEAQQMLRVCDATLWMWAKRGYLVPVKIGSRNHYRLSDVKRIMGDKSYA